MKYCNFHCSNIVYLKIGSPEIKYSYSVIVYIVSRLRRLVNSRKNYSIIAISYLATYSKASIIRYLHYSYYQVTYSYVNLLWLTCKYLFKRYKYKCIGILTSHFEFCPPCHSTLADLCLHMYIHMERFI